MLTVKKVLQGLEFIEKRRKLYDDIFEIIQLAKQKPKLARDMLAKNGNIDLYQFIEICKEHDLNADQLRTLLFGGKK